jgi:hypothetical protein
MSQLKLYEYFLCILTDKLVLKYDQNRTKYLIERYESKLVNKPTVERRNQIIVEEMWKEINDSIAEAKKTALVIPVSLINIFYFKKYLMFYLLLKQRQELLKNETVDEENKKLAKIFENFCQRLAHSYENYKYFFETPDYLYHNTEAALWANNYKSLIFMLFGTPISSRVCSICN